MNSKVFIETYGCQMNIYDSEVVLSLLEKEGYSLCEDIDLADLIIINTCSIRENAEQRVWGRLDQLLQKKKKNKELIVGILGCMAQRIKEELLNHPAVNIVLGPDSYRELPRLLKLLSEEKQINTILSQEETYADISPVRMDKNGVTSFISIMRGCNNMCTYCIVPYVRGRERSRDPITIVKEAANLYLEGYREVNLLGQNVDSYLWINPNNNNEKVSFANLLEMVAQISPQLRVRFATSHPKDMGEDVLHSMKRFPNICTHIHLPLQSGSNRMLEKMNRKYTIETYLGRVDKIREIIPEAMITTDLISGFCSETEEDHRMTLEIMSRIGFDGGFMFQYSERPNTKAARTFEDDVPLEIKTKRLNEIIELQNSLSLASNKKIIGNTYEVLIEGPSKRNKEELLGRTSGNKVCIFPSMGHNPGEYVKVKILSCTSATLKGEIVNS